mgnify:CR=1 FL=1
MDLLIIDHRLERHEVYRDILASQKINFDIKANESSDLFILSTQYKAILIHINNREMKMFNKIDNNSACTKIIFGDFDGNTELNRYIKKNNTRYVSHNVFQNTILKNIKDYI